MSLPVREFLHLLFDQIGEEKMWKTGLPGESFRFIDRLPDPMVRRICPSLELFDHPSFEAVQISEHFFAGPNTARFEAGALCSINLFERGE